MEDLPLFADSERQIEEAKLILKTTQCEEHIRLLASVYPLLPRVLVVRRGRARNLRPGKGWGAGRDRLR
jgi:hypothetical protein